jgi:hypothetical protein
MWRSGLVFKKSLKFLCRRIYLYAKEKITILGDSDGKADKQSWASIIIFASDHSTNIYQTISWPKEEKYGNIRKVQY